MSLNWTALNALSSAQLFDYQAFGMPANITMFDIRDPDHPLVRWIHAEPLEIHKSIASAAIWDCRTSVPTSHMVAMMPQQILKRRFTQPFLVVFEGRIKEFGKK